MVDQIMGARTEMNECFAFKEQREREEGSVKALETEAATGFASGKYLGGRLCGSKSFKHTNQLDV